MDIEFQGQIIRVPDGATEEQIRSILLQVAGQEAHPAVPAAEEPGWWDRTTEAWGNRLASDWQGLDNFVRMLANGATLGGADELAAGAQAVVDTGLGFFGDIGAAYDENLAAERARDAEIRTADPVGSAITEGIGAVGGGLAGASLPGIGRLFGLGGSSLLGRVGAGAALGGAAGATGGFLSAEGGLEPRLYGAGLGAAVGAPVGAVLPLASQLGGLAVRRLMGGSAPQSEAERVLASRIAADQMTPEEVASNLEALGPQGMIVDAAGPNVQSLGGVTYRQSGPAMGVAREALEDRAAGQGARIYDTFRAGLPGLGDEPLPDYFELISWLQTKRQTEAAPLYERAFATGGGITSDRVTEFLADPIIQRGIREGLEIQRLEALAAGRPFNPMDYAITGFNAAGDPIIGPVPNMRLLDAAKRGLDNILESYRDPTTGRLALDERGRAIDAVRRSWIDLLDTLNPDYAAARAAWAGPSQAMDAMARGRQLVFEDDRTIAGVLERMTPGEQEFFRVGVQDAIRRVIYSAPDAADIVKRIFGTEWKRGALRAVMGDDAFEAFRRQMEGEARFWDTQTRILSNSATAERVAADRANATGMGYPARLGADIATGVPLNANRMLLDLISSGAGPRVTPENAEAVARLLFSRTPEQNAATLGALRERGLLDMIERELAGGARTGVAGLVGSSDPSNIGGLLGMFAGAR